MKPLHSLKQTLLTSSLTTQEYREIKPLIHRDNREKLITATGIAVSFLLFMYILSTYMESISHARSIYLISLGLSVLLHLMARLSSRAPILTIIGIYLFIGLLLLFGILQSVYTAPEEQTASFIALLLALPIWFNDRPIRMITFIYLFTALFIAAVFRYKTGYVLESDLVNVTVYSTISVIMSSYTTCIKCQRHHALFRSDAMSKTDTLTGLGNRLAYMEFSSRYPDVGLPANLTLFCLDLNELKPTNDTLGHHMGDELLRGAAACIRSTFERYGSGYRTGGDEFVVVLDLPSEKLAELGREFDRNVALWSERNKLSLCISYGYASAHELEDATLAKLSKLADVRLYEAKSEYYRVTGHDRRGQ